MLLCWSRDDLIAYSRVRCELDQSLRETVSRLRLHRRGRRAGCRRLPAVAGVVTSSRSASNVNINKRSADSDADRVAVANTPVPALSTDVRHQPHIPSYQIPTLIGRRTLSTNTGHHAACKRVLIHVKRSPSTEQPTTVSNSQPLSRSSNFSPVPSLYVLNAAALAKPHAVNQLAIELSNYNVDVAVITETHFKTKHSDALVSVPGYSLCRRDKQGRRGGGVAIYVCSTLHSTPWKYTADDRLYELLWIQVGGTFFGALYHPPHSLYATDSLIDYIEASIDELIHDFPTTSIVLAGDFNQLSDSVVMQRTGLTQIVCQPTRGSNLLDRIFVSSPVYSTVRVVTSIVRSDHKAVIAFPDSRRLEGKKTLKKVYRRVTPAQHARFLDYISTLEFDVGDSNQPDTQNEFDTFYHAAVRLLNDF